MSLSHYEALEEMFDGIDASVFSSDMLEDAECRQALKEYCGRWLRAITIAEQPDIEGEDKQFHGTMYAGINTFLTVSDLSVADALKSAFGMPPAVKLEVATEGPFCGDGLYEFGVTVSNWPDSEDPADFGIYECEGE